MKIKNLFVAAVAGLLLTAAHAQDAAKPEAPKADAAATAAATTSQASAITELKTDKDRLSYALGALLAADLLKDPVEFNTEPMVLGFRHIIEKKKPILSFEEATQLRDNYQKEMEAKDAKRRDDEADKAKKDGKEFLEANAKKDGVKVLPSGLQYKVLKEGKADGKSPKPLDKATIHYWGKLVDGTEFDSSFKRGKPTTVPLNQVIKGWQEALQLMKTGAKWEIYVPFNLGYGPTEVGRVIKPFSALIYQIELIDVKEQ